MRQNITNSNFDLLRSFVSAVDLNLYYVMNSNEKSIHVFNEYWEYQRTIFPPSNEYLYNGPVSSIYVNGSIYVSSGSLLNKYDKYLNFTKQVIIINANVVGFYYNLANEMIYTVERMRYDINVYILKF